MNSVKVELPSVNGDPGIIWGVGFGRTEALLCMSVVIRLALGCSLVGSEWVLGWNRGW